MKVFTVFALLGLLYQPLMFAQEQADTLLDLGYQSYIDENYEEAITYFDRAEQLDTLNAELFYLRGICKSLMDNNLAAIADFNKAIAIDSNYSEAYFERGYSHFLLNEIDKSIQSYSEAIRIKPDYAEAYQNRGTVKCMANDVEGALKDWQKAEELGLQLPFKEC